MKLLLILEVICIETEAFYSLVQKTVEKLSGELNKPLDKWVDAKQAMEILGIKKTTLQKLRDEAAIEFSKVTAKTFLYNRFSLEAYIEKKKQEQF